MSNDRKHAQTMSAAPLQTDVARVLTLAVIAGVAVCVLVSLLPTPREVFGSGTAIGFSAQLDRVAMIVATLLTWALAVWLSGVLLVVVAARIVRGSRRAERIITRSAALLLPRTLRGVVITAVGVGSLTAMAGCAPGSAAAGTTTALGADRPAADSSVIVDTGSVAPSVPQSWDWPVDAGVTDPLPSPTVPIGGSTPADDPALTTTPDPVPTDPIPVAAPTDPVPAVAPTGADDDPAAPGAGDPSAAATGAGAPTTDLTGAPGAATEGAVDETPATAPSTTPPAAPGTADPLPAGPVAAPPTAFPTAGAESTPDPSVVDPSSAAVPSAAGPSAGVPSAAGPSAGVPSAAGPSAGVPSTPAQAAPTVPTTTTTVDTPNLPATVTVAVGDSLWSITAAHLPAGATDADIAAGWPRWYDTNRVLIGADPGQIRPGWQLTVPSDRQDNRS